LNNSKPFEAGNMNERPIGAIVWTDLTAPDANRVSAFYAAVVGLTPSPVAMYGYDDYNMLDANGEAATGVSHTRGINANLPAQWLVYFRVANLKSSVNECLARGGTIVDGPRMMGEAHFCCIQDPAGAVCAPIQYEPRRPEPGS
jgi:hypothetical protein